jgi:hypothetical protein
MSGTEKEDQDQLSLAEFREVLRRLSDSDRGEHDSEAASLERVSHDPTSSRE